MRSVEVPGVNCTMRRMGFAGYSVCALTEKTHRESKNTRIRFIGTLSGEARQDTLSRIRRKRCLGQQGVGEAGFEGGGDVAQRIARRKAVHVN